jgi:hypothetical protein
MGIIYILLFIFAVYYNILNIFSLGALLNIIFVILIIFAFITFYRVVKQKVLCTTKTLNDLKEGDLLVNNYYKKGKKVIIKSTSMLKSIKLMLIGSYSKDLVIDSKKTGGLSKSDISFLNDTRHI